VNGDPLSRIQQIVHGAPLSLPGDREIGLRRVIVLNRQMKPLQTALLAQFGKRGHGVVDHFQPWHQGDYRVGPRRLQLFKRDRRFDSFRSGTWRQDQAAFAMVKRQEIEGMCGHDVTLGKMNEAWVSVAANFTRVR
jgi:hypothetical protein